MSRPVLRTQTWFAIAGLAAAAASAGAGTDADFCDGVTPPAPDAFEPNNSFAEATPITPYQEALPLNFDSADDEEWFFFRGFDFPNDGAVYEFTFPSTSPGDGILMTTAEPFEGAGLFYRFYEIQRAGLVEIGPPEGAPGSLEPIEQGCIEETSLPISFFFRAEADYAIQITQCRNEMLFINGGDIDDRELYCLPQDAGFGLQIGPGIGFQGGTLAGTITDALSSQPIPLAAVIGSNVGLTAYSAPGSGSFSGLATVISGGTASVIRDGYETQEIQFDLEQNETTPCDVALLPSGVIFANGFEQQTGGLQKGAPPACTPL
ncbi:MAG: hypothetical protein AAGA23_03455 [Pseudomonadota bacterium]